MFYTVANDWVVDFIQTVTLKWHGPYDLQRIENKDVPMSMGFIRFFKYIESMKITIHRENIKGLSYPSEGTWMASKRSGAD